MRRIASILAAMALFVAAPAGADQAEPQGEPRAESGENASAETGDETPEKPPVFVPPKRGAPLTRVGAATRGAEDEAVPMIWTLAPEESGLTTEARPTLYWYLSGPSQSDVELGVVGAESGAKLVKTTLAGPFDAGIQSVDLDALGAQLEPGVHYRWYVALVVDPQDRTRDRVATAGVEYAPATPQLVKELTRAGTAQTPHVLAEAGLWYDALDALSTRIESRPDDARLREHRAALLEQVGLPEVARAERQPRVAAQ